MLNNYFKFKNKKAGFSVLFASLIGSLVLSIGLAILSIALKQILLASAGRESQRAFYAADTGIECALFLDSGGGDESCNSVFPLPGSDLSICGIDDGHHCVVNINVFENQPLVNEIDSETVMTIVNVTNLGTEPANNTCFDLYVTKRSTDGGVTVKTEIESRGYNTCDVNAKNRFERAILTTY